MKPRESSARERDKDPRPTAEALAVAHQQLLPDLIAPALRVLFVGINPGLYSTACGHHFARPGNRFWPALALAGLTPRLYRPSEDGLLLALGLGITNLVARTTARAAELEPEELSQGARTLASKVAHYQPRVVAVLGVTAYRVGFESPRAKLGLQEARCAGARVTVLPNPSGLNAHHQLPALAQLFAQLTALG